jgi:hypothetical protein
MVLETPLNKIQIYLNGLKLEDGRIGWGYTIRNDHSTLHTSKGSLGVRSEVYDTELWGTSEGLKNAILHRKPNHERIIVLFDNYVIT